MYSVRVEAVNGAGSVSSPWVSIRTLEASPAGLANFSLEQREQGRALLLTWDTPHTPNGVITVHTETDTHNRVITVHTHTHTLHTYTETSIKGVITVNKLAH